VPIGPKACIFSNTIPWKLRQSFCKRCGIHAFGEGTHPNGTEMAAINVRCLEDIDIDALPVTHFDGRSV